MHYSMSERYLPFPEQLTGIVQAAFEVSALAFTKDFTEHLTDARTMCAAMMFQNAKLY